MAPKRKRATAAGKGRKKARVVSDPGTVSATRTGTQKISEIPLEISINIIHHLDIVSAVCLSLTNKRMHAIFKALKPKVFPEYNHCQIPLEIRSRTALGFRCTLKTFLLEWMPKHLNYNPFMQRFLGPEATKEAMQMQIDECMIGRQALDQQKIDRVNSLKQAAVIAREEARENRRAERHYERREAKKERQADRAKLKKDRRRRFNSWYEYRGNMRTDMYEDDPEADGESIWGDQDELWEVYLEDFPEEADSLGSTSSGRGSETVSGEVFSDADSIVTSVDSDWMTVAERNIYHWSGM